MELGEFQGENKARAFKIFDDLYKKIKEEFDLMKNAIEK